MDGSMRKLTVLDQITASDKVRRKIIDVASALYAKKGFGATSIQEISEGAGVTLPVTYHYVKKKSEIMAMIMEDVLSTFQESLRENIMGVEDPQEKLAIAVVLFFRVLDRNREKALLIYQKSNSLDKSSKARVMQLEVDISEIFARIIREGMKRGTFRSVDVDLMAYNILMMAYMWPLKGWHFRKRLSLDEFINAQLEIINKALTK